MCVLAVEVYSSETIVLVSGCLVAIETPYTNINIHSLTHSHTTHTLTHTTHTAVSTR